MNIYTRYYRFLVFISIFFKRIKESGSLFFQLSEKKENKHNNSFKSGRITIHIEHSSEISNAVLIVFYFHYFWIIIRSSYFSIINN